MSRETIKRARRVVKAMTPITDIAGSEMILPNTSGDHVRSIKRDIPIIDADLANKKYVDDNATSPGGADTNIQYNNSGSFGGDADFTWDNANKRLGIGTTDVDYTVDMVGGTFGGFRFSQSDAAGTIDRFGGLVVRHSNPAEEDVALGFAHSAAFFGSSTANIVYWGGGLPVFNTATAHWFYVAANPNTLTGTKILSVDLTGVKVYNSFFGTSGSHTRLNTNGDDYDFTVKSSNDNFMLFVDGGEDRVGVGTGTPTTTLEVNGAIASAVKTITASSDAVDVSGVNTVFINPGAAVVIGGFANGVTGQRVDVIVVDTDQNVTMEDEEATGTQKLRMHQSADETLASERGGWSFVFDGTYWYDISHARHV